jgi:hypothetical protein
MRIEQTCDCDDLALHDVYKAIENVVRRARFAQQDCVRTGNSFNVGENASHLVFSPKIGYALSNGVQHSIMSLAQLRSPPR